MSDFKGIEFTDLLGLSQPLTKFVEVVSKGIGYVYEPYHKTRMAKATAEEIQLIANSCQENIHVPVIYNKAGVEITTDKSTADLAHRAFVRNLFQEMNKQQNIEHILRYAKENLEKEKEVSPEPVSQTWLSNFFESAGHVEESDLQKIWGDLLAGEIKKPHSYSLRTLNVLRNMNKQEALAFQRLLKFAMWIESKYFVPKNENFEKQYKINFEEILLLDECGLINSHGTLNLDFEGEPYEEMSVQNNILCAKITEKTGSSLHVHINMYPLTEAGKELFSIINIEPDIDFFNDYIKNISDRYKNITTNICKNKK